MNSKSSLYEDLKKGASDKHGNRDSVLAQTVAIKLPAHLDPADFSLIRRESSTKKWG